jgi:hypothetical protein
MPGSFYGQQAPVFPQQQLAAQIPYGVFGAPYPYGMGIGHSSPTTLNQPGLGLFGTTQTVDPLYSQRIQQTFPFVTIPFSPIV